MRNTRLWLGLLLAGAATAAGAAGLGAASSGAVLGQALDFTTQLRLDPGDALAPDCLSAEVTVGDRSLPASAVRTAFEMTSPELARVRVMTTLAVDEPVVGIRLRAGCATRLERRFVVLADPPALPIASRAPALLPAAETATTDAGGATAAFNGAPGPLLAAATLPAAAESAAAAPPPVPAPRPRAAARDDRRHERRADRRADRRAESRAQSRGDRRAATAMPLRRVAARNQPAPLAAAAIAPAEPLPRLRLEPADTRSTAAVSAEAVAIEQALLAVAQAASAAREAASAASASAARIAGLEREVTDLRSQAQASRDLVAQLRERAEQPSRWTWLLLACVALLAGLALWLWRQLASAQRERNLQWRQVAAGAAVARPAEPAPATVSPPSEPAPTTRQLTAPIPFVTSELPRPQQRPAFDAWSATAAASVPPVAAVPAYERTDVLPPRAAQPEAGDGPARDVSIEELIDLEQQAEFFVVLGQDEAAVELLVEHLRHTGGGSPLPYLKLLEIHRRRGERADYERTRQRFNHRFNAYAPDWSVDLAAGRSLDDYPGIVPRLQQVWPRPLDAMAEMEALLFRRSRGELFDLPAYRELLFLYALARDLLDREAVDSGNVDLLLPIADGTEFSSTTPTPYLGLEREPGTAERRRETEDRPTAPLDFDLTLEAEERPISIFDPLDGGTARAPRR